MPPSARAGQASSSRGSPTGPIAGSPLAFRSARSWRAPVPPSVRARSATAGSCVLRLVGDNQAPAHLGEPCGVPQHHAVGDQDDLVNGQFLQVPAASVVPADRNVGGEPAYLPLPSAKQRCW